VFEQTPILPRWPRPARRPEQKQNFSLAAGSNGAKDRPVSNGASAMVQVRRHGLGDPKAVFDELRPYRERLIMLMGQCAARSRPTS